MILCKRAVTAGRLLLSGLYLILGTGCNSGSPPLPPDEATSSFRLPPGFRIELVAAEPLIQNPVAMTFDARGKLYVAEMHGYPASRKPWGRIKLLDDADADGRMDQSTVFAEFPRDGQCFPSGLTAWKSGLLVICAPDILYLKDADGDGKAEIREIVLTGLDTTRPTFVPNGLLHGIDNWIYVAHPRYHELSGRIYFPRAPEVFSDAVFALGTDFRFRPEEPAIEPTGGNSQYGNAFDAWGNRFLVRHNNHIRHVVLEHRYAVRNPYLKVESVLFSPSDHGSQSEVYSIAEDPLYVHQSQVGIFTSACGNSVYNGGQFPEAYQGAYFVAEPVSSLVHCDFLTPGGVSFTASRAMEEKEFLASTDAWFRPVFTSGGPDGALYVADMYRRQVEHPDHYTGDFLKEENLKAGDDRGRIYRILHKTSAATAVPDLERITGPQLVALLKSPNSWQRSVAQRLLVERGDQSVREALEDLAGSASTAEARVHALWTLEGLDVLNVEPILNSLDDSHPEVRRHAIRLAEEHLADARVRTKLFGMAQESAARVAFQLACTLGGVPFHDAFNTLQEIAVLNLEDSWFQLAILTSAADTASQWLNSLRSDNLFGEASSTAREAFAVRMASVLGARNEPSEVHSLLSSVAQTDAPMWWRVASLKGLAEGLHDFRAQITLPSQYLLLNLIQSGSSDAIQQAALAVGQVIQWVPTAELTAVLSVASRTAANPELPIETRLFSIDLLGLDPDAASRPVLASLLSPKESDEIQIAAARSLLAYSDGGSARILLERWKTYTPPVREMVLTSLWNQPECHSQLLEAISKGWLPVRAISRVRQNQLTRSNQDEVRRRARELFASSTEERRGLFDRYVSAVHTEGDVDRGRGLFRELCSSCHRVEGFGFDVGPNLESVTVLDKVLVLRKILDPNSVEMVAGYENYLIETTDGRRIDGVIAESSPTAITLRRSQGEEDTVLRSKIVKVQASDISLMPEGLEEGKSISDLSDLLEYVKQIQPMPAGR